MQKTEEVKIDTNLYSRQIGTFGLETMGKLVKLKVLIVGLRGLGVETAKNIILAGPASVTLYDPTIARVNDMGSNFYLTQAHIGKATRADACLQQLSELNNHVKVGVISSLTMEDHLNYNVVCYTERFENITNLEKINEFCRANKVGFILSETLGAAGYAFLDYGNSHIVTDHDGEATKSFIVVAISQDENAVITVHEDKRHTYQEGDFVKFVEVEGMTEINNREPIEIIEVKGPFSFKIKADSRKWTAYARQGVIENVKVPRTVSYLSLQESRMNPAKGTQDGCLQTVDFTKFGRSEQLHVAIQGLFATNESFSTEAVVDVCKQLNESAKAQGNMYVDEFDADVVRKVVEFASCSICPMSAFLGGIVAQEVVKFTGKYSPLKQWLHYDCFEALPDKNVDRTPMGSRYDDQIKIFGRETQEKLFNVNTFMVGSGALGCELIKAFALMGVGCGPQGKVHNTDNDNIEVSNLNRQFLFRKGHVGHSKSQTACEIAKGMNPDLNVQSYTTIVSPDTEAVFNDKFWESLDFVVNAVDNVKARLYVDSKCVWYEKPLLESGTLGTKANSQMIVPHQTLCYGDSQDPPEESIPMCTLRNFPNQIEHCIEWGREQFNHMFVDRAQDAISYIENSKQFLFELRKNTTSSGALSSLREIQKLLDLKQNADYTKCVEISKDLFNYYYDHNIRDLLSIFPKDHKDSHGMPFWSGPKRAPDFITFDANDELSLMFIMACANLIAYNLGLKQEQNSEVVRKIASQIPSKPYVPKQIKVETPEEQKAREERKEPAPQQPGSEDDEAQLTEIHNLLSNHPQVVGKAKIQCAEFEKDDDTNFHIDFIHAVSCLRARNYKIHECDHGKTKMIAGKIIPAIATTTAMITGVVSVEMYKFVQGFNTIEKFRNSFINLALPLFVFSEPDNIKKTKSKEYDPIMCGPVKAIPEGFTIYDKITVNQGSITLQQFFDYIEKTHGLEISMVACGQIALYNAYLPGGKHKARLSQKVEDIYLDIKKEGLPETRYYLILELGGSTKDGDDFICPPVKYCFK